MKRPASAFLIAAALLFLSSCAVGPNYKRPTVSTPPDFRGSLQPAAPASLAETKWFDLFQDEVLKNLVETAIANNFDLRIASERVLEARAQYGVQRSSLYPTLNANAQFDSNRNSTIGGNKFVPAGTNIDASYTNAGFQLSWELDIWGRLRRLNEAARAQYLGSEEARRGVLTTLIADVTTSYFNLLELDLELDIARRNRDVAANGLRLTNIRKGRGVGTGLDVHQAEQFLYTATARIAATERAIGQTENALSLLLGRSPSDIPRGNPLEKIPPPPEIPAGIPSDLLGRRPDIRYAEQNLISANAQIGAARAQYFPQITLTGLLGAQSRALTDLFTGPARAWTLAPGATLPIFNAGRIRNNVRFTEAQQRDYLAQYEKSIQNAFREVSNALIGYRKDVEERIQEERLVEALRETDRLSQLRYQGGLDSYLQVLDAERNLFQGELTLAQLRREQLLSIVQLYRALGGGWQ